MIIYANGDGNVAASYAVNDYAIAEDEYQLWHQGRQPHPQNKAASWAQTLANIMKCACVNLADPRNNEQDIINAVTDFAIKHKDQNPVVVIGFQKVDTPSFLGLSEWLKERKIKHLFFPTQDYIDFLVSEGYKQNKYGYFGQDAHTKWAFVVSDQLTRVL